MLYKVITRFKDGQDDGHLYQVDDLYPRKGLEPSEERIDALTTTNNRREVVAIEPIQLDSLKVAELKDIARQLDVEGYSTLKKAELVEAIEEVE